MIIFAQKHFHTSHKSSFVFFIKVAIYLRAMMAFLFRIFSTIQFALLDLIVSMSSLWLMKWLWTKQVKTDTQYSTPLLLTFFVGYSVIWLIALFLSGAYDRPYKSSNVLRGMLIGGLLSLALYGLLPEDFRFSRGITVLGALFATLSILMSRKILWWMGVERAAPDITSDQRVIIVGTEQEENAIRTILKKAHIEKNIIGTVSPLDSKEPYQLGVFKHLKFIAHMYRVTEIMFAQGHLNFKEIISAMQQCGPEVAYKMSATGMDSIIGSNSKHTAGDLYTTQVNFNIASPASRRNKRIIDICSSLILLLFSPIVLWLLPQRFHFIKELWRVLLGRKTMVGYEKHDEFPVLKNHVLKVYSDMEDYPIPQDNKEHLEWLYAKYYTAYEDIRIICTNWMSIGE
jgi:hypothetical protein